MADDINKNEESEEKSPRVVRQADQTVPPSKFVELDLSIFFEPRENEKLIFRMEKCPSGLVIDENTGILKGMSPPDVGKTYLLQVSATSNLTGFAAHVIFNLYVKDESVAEAMDDFGLQKNIFKDLGPNYENRIFTQHFINQYFLYIHLQDGMYPDAQKGALLNVRKADTRWSVFHYEHAVIISPGDCMFEDGNRGKLLRTLGEVYRRDIADRGWQSLLIFGSDIENIGRAWVVAKELNMPVSDAPNYIAEINYYTVERLRRR